MDLSISTKRFPSKGETISGSDFLKALGGKGLNQAVAAAKLGGNVYMCGAIGDDDFGKEALKVMDENHINHDFVEVKNTSTGTAIIILAEGDNSIVINGGANLEITNNQIDKFLAFAKEGDIFLTQLENNLDATGYALEQASKKGMFVVLNPAPMKTEISPYLSYVDLITPNETELELFGGLENLSKLSSNIIVTLGSKGFRVYNKDIDQVYPCMKITPVDTVAAGDTLCGGLVSQLSKGVDLVDAAKFASKAASIACTRRGAIPSIPSYEEVISY